MPVPFEDRVLDIIKGSGAGGKTCDDLENEMHLPYLVIRTQLDKLKASNRILASGRSRRSSNTNKMVIVWVATPDPVAARPILVETPVSMEPLPLLTLPNTQDPVGPEALLPIKRKCLECVRCALSKTRTQVLFGEGNAHEPLICFIAEAPSLIDETEGRLFSGPSGRKLDQILDTVGLRRDEIYLCSVVACRPPGNRPPEKIEVVACFEYLRGQIRAVRPKTIVALGATAVQALIGGKKKISELRGRWFEWEGIPVMPTYPPSHLCRVERLAEGVETRKQTYSDILQVAAKIGLRKAEA